MAKRALKRVIIICGLGHRLECFFQAITSLRQQKEFDQWDVFPVLTGLTDTQKNQVRELVKLGLFFERMQGPYIPKLRGLRACRGYDIYCFSDDDVIFIDKTHYDSIIPKLCDPLTGLVMGNHAQSEKAMKRRQYAHVFKKDPQLANGGGLLFTEKIARLFRRLPDAEVSTDDTVFSLVSYVHGFINYRYYGSLLIHTYNRGDGHRRWIKDVRPRPLYAPRKYIRREVLQDGNHIRLQSAADLTPYAKKLHKENQQRIQEKGVLGIRLIPFDGKDFTEADK